MSRPPIDRRFVAALRSLDYRGLSYAEAWRLLLPVAERIGLPRPSYFSVRRTLIVERRRRARRKAAYDRVLGAVIAGRVPSLEAVEALREAIVF
ncbi:MAG TPA: hypothetical protein VF101_19590 [Gaiellaceae bacterium]